MGVFSGPIMMEAIEKNKKLCFSEKSTSSCQAGTPGHFMLLDEIKWRDRLKMRKRKLCATIICQEKGNQRNVRFGSSCCIMAALRPPMEKAGVKE